LGGIQLNLVGIGYKASGYILGVDDDKRRDRHALQGGGTGEQLLVTSTHAGDKPFFTKFFGGGRHGHNVATIGTHFNIGFSSILLSNTMAVERCASWRRVVNDLPKKFRRDFD
jgi:hypothetical protein